MGKNVDTTYDIPVGLHFSNIAKQYIGVLTKKLSHLEFDRYYYTVAIIGKFDGTLTQQQLADILGVDKVYMVKIIDYLSKKGLVKRKRNKSDRREYFLELTEKANVSLDEIKTALRETNEATFNHINEKDLQSFYCVLEKMASNLKLLPAEQVELNIKKR